MNILSKFFLIAASFLPILPSAAQQKKPASGEEKILHTTKGDVYGTLETVPAKKAPVVLIIAGSGPTDRNGNNMYQQNNSLKMLADSLQHYGIASLRYDKRGIGESKKAATEDSLRFTDYITDAEDWIKLLEKDKRFSKVIVLGHSEGSLIGMAAANHVPPAAFISVSGAGKPADQMIRHQLEGHVPVGVMDTCNLFLDALVAGKTVHNTDKKLDNIFRASVQPYLISWFRYNPVHEIATLKMPILILQGTTDLQVEVADATLLAAANPAAKVVTITNMNHVLKYADADQQKNIATYSDPALPLKPELVKEVVSFIKKQ